MIINLIIAQYKQSYEGQYMPNVVDAWDEYVMEDNHEGFQEALAKHEAMVGTEYEGVKVLQIRVPDQTVLDLFAPPKPVEVDVEVVE